jgi:hypothetical protein
MLKISAVYLIGEAEIPIHYTTWAPVEQALSENKSSYRLLTLSQSNSGLLYLIQPLDPDFYDFQQQKYPGTSNMII